MTYIYYNCLICTSDPATLQVQRNNQISQLFLQGYFGDHFEISRGVNICIEAPQHLKREFKQQIQCTLSLKNIDFTKINSSWTANKEISMMNIALSNLNVVSPTTDKQPAQLQNLSILRQYFSLYRSEGQMKQFLKGLLIEEISHERKNIQYQSVSSLKAVITEMINNLRGEITFDQISTEEQLWIVVIDQQNIQDSQLRQIMAIIDQKYKVNHSVNSSLTNQFTFSPLCQSQIRALTNNFIQLKITSIRKQIKALASDLQLIADLKAVLREGIKIVQQQKQLQQSFLTFVAEMTTKYSGQLIRYFTTFHQQNIYQQDLIYYHTTNHHKKEIQKYLQSFGSLLNFKTKHKKWQNKNCNLIQQRVRSFLTRRRMQKECFSSYLKQKQQQRKLLQKYYLKFIEYYNTTELHKLKSHNRYKYGFSCCTHILAVNSPSSQPLFDPQRLLSLAQTANKHQQIITKIDCTRDTCELTTIEGKAYRLGQSVRNSNKMGIGKHENYNSFNHQSTKTNNQKSPNYRSNQHQKLSLILAPLNSKVNYQQYSQFKVNPTYKSKDNKKHQSLTQSSQNYGLQSSFVISQKVNSFNDTFFLSDNHKVYSFAQQQFIRIPRQISFNFNHFHLIRTGTSNLEIVYLVAFWTNSIDKHQRKQITNYLTHKSSSSLPQSNESMLFQDISNEFLDGNHQQNNLIELSAIIEESQC